jgi:hypothetical protein
MRVRVLVLVATSHNSERLRTANLASAAPPITDALAVCDDATGGSTAEKCVTSIERIDPRY